MNTRILVLVVFALWSAFCWRWYVCGIMNACSPNDSADGIELESQASSNLQPTTTTLSPTTETLEQNPPVSPDKMEEVQMETVEDQMVIHFPYNSTRKEDNNAIDAYLTQLARQLMASGQKVSIHGHTDFVGDARTNYPLGLKRATGIRDILVQKGVPKTQITCKSSGDKKPVATNDTPYGRYLNRRVEIRVGP